MVREPFHLSDEEILLVADGEIPRHRARKARAHLNACWLCRSRLADFGGTIADFVSLHRSTLDPHLPAGAGPRSLLKARLAAAVAEPSNGSCQRFLQLISLHRAAAYVCLVGIVTLLAGQFFLRHSLLPRSAPGSAFASGHRSRPVSGPALGPALSAALATPDHDLTPGATRQVSIGAMCSAFHEEVVRDVPTGVRQKVFKRYGIVNPRTEDYEIDYLIAPGLGGTDDIHNLWPEPYTTSAWNAHVKDALEERLHQLVCDGKVDLPTAQREIATDWISAYKKYLVLTDM